MMRFLLPLGAFLLLVALLYVGLGLNPREVPSPLVGRPAPAFALPTLADPERRITEQDLAAAPVTLLNVWASWCAACVEEHPVLSAWVKRRGLPLVGLNYKDDSEQARAWLARFGNPFRNIAVDRDGRVGIDWGVYGVPETFVIDRAGIIRYKHIGPLTPQVIAEKLDPLIDALQLAGGAP